MRTMARVCDIGTLQATFNRHSPCHEGDTVVHPHPGSTFTGSGPRPWRMLPGHRCLASSSMRSRCPPRAFLTYQEALAAFGGEPECPGPWAGTWPSPAFWSS